MLTLPCHQQLNGAWITPTSTQQPFTSCDTLPMSLRNDLYICATISLVILLPSHTLLLHCCPSPLCSSAGMLYTVVLPMQKERACVQHVRVLPFRVCASYVSGSLEAQRQGEEEEKKRAIIDVFHLVCHSCRRLFTSTWLPIWLLRQLHLQVCLLDHPE